MINFLREKRYSKLKFKYKEEKKKVEELESKLLDYKNNILELEKDLENRTLTNLEVDYLKSLIQLDETLNSHKHGTRGLYSELDEDLLDFIYSLRSKLEKLKENK